VNAILQPTESSCSAAPEVIALDSLLARAQSLAEAGQRTKAIELCEQGLVHFPHSPALWSELGSNYLEEGAIEAAELGFRAALQFAPGHPELMFSLCVALQKQWRYDEARPLLESVVAQLPDHHQAWSNLSGVWGWQGQYSRQLEALARALALEPQNASYRWNRAVARLRQGQFGAGWADYEARYQTLPKPPTPCTWTGEEFAQQSLWVACEQGLGDTLQFMRFLPWARARVGRLVLACPTALKPFLEAQGCADEVVASDGTPPPGMASIRLMSLPHLMQLQHPSDIPTQPYLRPDAARVLRIFERLSSSSGLGKRPRVALSWQGSKTYGADAQRSMPLAHLLPLLREWAADFVSVQKNHGSEQLDSMPADVQIQRLRDEDDCDGAFLDTAAILSTCQLFITTDSSVAHLAGGLGVRTVLLLPYAPDWRWGTPEHPISWYDSVTPLFQRSPGDWAELASRVRLQFAP
jgi:Tfp pilus assembly protein PilF